MPRFFFHVHDDFVAPDEDGQVCANAEAAREIAIKSARELICERIRQGQLFLRHYIAVTDEDGGEQFRVLFQDAVEIEG